MYIFEWVFRMYEKKMYKSADSLGYAFAVALLRLNEESLYYNTLTYRLLYKERISSKKP